MSFETMTETMSTANVEQAAVPLFGVTKVEASLRYYVDGLGFEMTNQWAVDGKVWWCWLQCGGAALMLQEFWKDRVPTGKLGEGVSVCFTCKDALAIYREVMNRGINAKRPFVGK